MPQGHLIILKDLSKNTLKDWKASRFKMSQCPALNTWIWAGWEWTEERAGVSATRGRRACWPRVSAGPVARGSLRACGRGTVSGRRAVFQEAGSPHKLPLPRSPSSCRIRAPWGPEAAERSDTDRASRLSYAGLLWPAAGWCAAPPAFDPTDAANG